MSTPNRNRITMGLLFVSVMFLLISATYHTWQADREEPYLIQHAADMRYDELKQRVDALITRAETINPGASAEEYFAIREDAFPLQYAAKKLSQKERERGDVAARVHADILASRAGNAFNVAANAYKPYRRSESPERSDAFIAARERTEQRMAQRQQAVIEALGPDMPRAEFLAIWARTVLGCFPFSLLWVALLFRNRGHDWWDTAGKFFDTWNPLIASAVPVIGPLLVLHGPRDEDLRSRFRLLARMLCGLMTVAGGGFGAAIAKAHGQGEKDKKASVTTLAETQSPQQPAVGPSPQPTPLVATKKRPWTALAYFRSTEANLGKPHQQPQGLARLTLTGPSGNGWVEGQAIFNRTSVTSEGYAGRFLLNRKTSFFDRAKFGPFAGLSMTETRHTSQRVASYRALFGMRFSLTKGRLNFFSPLVQAEVPLNQRAKLALVGVLRSTVRLTNRFSLVEETSAKGTRGAKPTSGAAGLFGLLKLRKNVTFEFGPTVTQKGIWGFRTAAFISF